MTQNQCTTLLERFEPLYESLKEVKSQLEDSEPKDVMRCLGHTAAVIGLLLDELNIHTDKKREFSDEVLRTIAGFTINVGCRIDMVINNHLSYTDVIFSLEELLKYFHSAINVWKFQEMLMQFANDKDTCVQSRNILLACASNAPRISYLIGLDSIMS